jgi:tetratricopeptide (TPR) repeat protein
LLEAVKLRSDSATAYNTLGMALSRFVENTAAKEAFEKALQLDPKLADAHVNLSLVLAQSNQLALAAEHLDKAIRLEGDKPSAARAWYLRAKIHGEQNELDAALRDLERAVQLRPDFAEAWSDLGSTRRALLNDEGALRAFERAVKLDPRSSRAQFRLGSAYLRDSNFTKAIIHLNEAARLDSANRAILYNLQRAYSKAGRTAEAEQVGARMERLLRQSTRASETSLQAAKLNNDGIALEKAGDQRGALGKYESALDLDPEHSGFRLNAGLALCRLGRWDEGINQIREVVRRDPNNAEATRALYIAMDLQPGKSASEGRVGAKTRH